MDMLNSWVFVYQYEIIKWVIFLVHFSNVIGSYTMRYKRKYPFVCPNCGDKRMYPLPDERMIDGLRILSDVLEMKHPFITGLKEPLTMKGGDNVLCKNCNMETAVDIESCPKCNIDWVSFHRVG
jgi:hypothetical protein